MKCKYSILSHYLVFIVFQMLLLISCKKLVEIDSPLTSANQDVVYSSDATAIAVLNGLYTRMSQNGIQTGITSMSLYGGLSADELVLFPGTTNQSYLAYFRNNLSPTNLAGNDFWTQVYPLFIYVTNAAVEGLTTSNSLTPTVKNQLLGEAKFMRALCYFYLVNLYGDVPLVLTTDFKTNSNISRSLSTDVYNQIVIDLKDAQSLLSDNYLDGTLLNSSVERIAPTKWAATALLSRAYLYMNDWSNAVVEATSIIDKKSLFDTVSIKDVFLANSKEAIWQLKSVDNVVTNTSDARFFILPSTGPNTGVSPVYMSNNLRGSFEMGDLRIQWLDSVESAGVHYVYPAKYKNNVPFSPVSEYTAIFRLAEQFLIRSEARAKLNQLEAAREDLNVIRKRAGLSLIESNSPEDLLRAILHERQVELFTEWGHRWFDLKRTGNANKILAPIKGGDWQETDQLYPIPQEEINKNRSLLGHQNPGY